MGWEYVGDNSKPKMMVFQVVSSLGPEDFDGSNTLYFHEKAAQAFINRHKYTLDGINASFMYVVAIEVEMDEE